MNIRVVIISSTLGDVDIEKEVDETFDLSATRQTLDRTLSNVSSMVRAAYGIKED